MADESETYQKITRRIVPLLFVAYLCAFLDRVNISYAQLQMKADLGFSDATYGFGAGIFFVSYLLFEVPSNILLERIGARITLLRIMVLWGLTSAGTMFVATPMQFYAARFLLGLFEGGFFPGMILYLTYWYPGTRRAAVTGQFMFAVPVAGIIGGPLSGWIMASLDVVAGLAGWRWLFLLEGLPTTLFGVVCFVVLRDRPADAAWLTQEEKELVERNLRTDSAGPGAKHPLRKVLTDVRVWILAFIYFACACASYVYTFWLPTLIKDLGVSSVARIGWYAAIPGAFAGAGVLLITRSSDRFRERRWHVGGSLIIAAVLLSATTLQPSSIAMGLGLLCVCGFFLLGAAIAYWSIPPTYLGADAAAVGIGLISSVGVLGGFVGPTLLGFKGVTTGILIVAVIMIAGGLVTVVGLPRSATRVGVGT
jgi:D-galactonate transporter